MIQLVGDDGILGTQQCLKEATVCVEAGAVQDRILSTQEVRDAALELFVNLGGAADKAYRGHAEAPTIKGLLSGCDHGRVISEAEVVIRAEVDQPLITNSDPSRLRRADHCLGLEEAFGRQRPEIISESILESAVHDPTYPSQFMITFPPWPERATAQAFSYSV